ncbi:right-handed parallel beta-helix repeat-containing protein [bacterium]|nr:right-handed parallel beta-helix repeat-containing protein [bacterium]
MRNKFAMLAVTAALLCLFVCAAWAGPAVNKVYAGNVDSFIKAIKSNTTIVLKPGTYNISEWLNNENNKITLAEGEHFVDTHTGIAKDSVHDGVQLDIYGLENLSIVSEQAKDPARIVCEPRYAQVLYFARCKNIRLENVVMGHTPEKGHCSGNVLSLFKCSGVSVKGADLYGCGAYGLEIGRCEDVKIEGCKVHDCTYGCAMIYDTNMTIADSSFYDCKEFTMFELSNSQVNFNKCSFRNLQGGFVAPIESKAVFSGCSFDAKTKEEVFDNIEYGKNIFVK